LYAEHTWGRKESIVWPYQIPIYAYSAAFLSAVFDLLFRLRLDSLCYNALAAVLPAAL